MTKRCGTGGYGKEAEEKRRRIGGARVRERYAREERNRWPRTQHTILPSETEEKEEEEEERTRKREGIVGSSESTISRW